MMDPVLYPLAMAIVLDELTILVDVLIYRRVGRDEYCRRELGLVAYLLVRELGIWGFLVGAILSPLAIVMTVALCYCWGGREAAMFAVGVFAAGCLIMLVNDAGTLAELRPEYVEQRARELLALAERLRRAG